jgi:hypothetical protein
MAGAEEAAGPRPRNRQAGLADDASPEASPLGGAASLLGIPRRSGSVGQRRCGRSDHDPVIAGATPEEKERLRALIQAVSDILSGEDRNGSTCGNLLVRMRPATRSRARGTYWRGAMFRSRGLQAGSVTIILAAWQARREISRAGHLARLR